MLAVVVLVLIGVFNVEVVDQAQTGARSKLSWTVSFLKGGFCSAYRCYKSVNA